MLHKRFPQLFKIKIVQLNIKRNKQNLLKKSQKKTTIDYHSRTFSNKGMLIASGSRDGSVVASFLKKDGNGDPVGAAFAGDLVGAISWRPDDCALAAVNAKGLVNVWKFKVRTNLSSEGFK